MAQIGSTESLLPWLVPESSRVYLKIIAEPHSSSISAPSYAPFTVLDDSSPVARLLHASFVMASGRVLKEVSLLVQKDRYSFINGAPPLDNLEIERLWQDAGGLDYEGNEAAPFFMFTEGGAHPPVWRSLFYCKKMDCFFHPPCSRCGTLLELCSDDQILNAAALPPYTSSIDRFLYCPACHEAGKTEFYTFHEQDAFRYGVKDRMALISSFGRLSDTAPQASALPCTTCRYRQACCETENNACSFITPFAFYPFRMAMGDAGKMGGQDFISVISGRPVRETNCPGSVFPERDESGSFFFFDDGECNFLEVLYLKTAFLAQAGGIALSSLKYLRHQDLRLTMNQFRVDFSWYSGLLPLYWNFRVIPLALGITPPENNFFMRPPEVLGFYSLARLWFDAMLVNSSQSAGHVTRALALLMQENGLETEPEFRSLMTREEFSVFSPENIFWYPEERKNSFLSKDPFTVLWEKALDVGWFLVRASFNAVNAEKDSVADIFSQRTSELCDLIKRDLFPGTVRSDTVAQPAVEMGTSDDDIRNILINLREKWQPVEKPLSAGEEFSKETNRAEAAGTIKAPAATAQEETLALNPEELSEMEGKESQVPLSSSSAPLQAGSSERTEEGLNDGIDREETVILTPDQFSSIIGMGEDSAAASSPDVSPSYQTSGKVTAPVTPEARPAGDDSHMEETVILRPDQDHMTARDAKHAAAPVDTGMKQGESSGRYADRHEEEPLSELEETVIIHPEDIPKAGFRQTSSRGTSSPDTAAPAVNTQGRSQGVTGVGIDSADDELLETVVIHPGETAEELSEKKKR